LERNQVVTYSLMEKYLILVQGGLTLSFYQTLDRIAPMGCVYSNTQNVLTDSLTFSILNNCPSDTILNQDLTEFLVAGPNIMVLLLEHNRVKYYSDWAVSNNLDCICLRYDTPKVNKRIVEPLFFKLVYSLRRFESQDPSDKVGKYLHDLRTYVLNNTTIAEQNRFCKYISTALRYT
jgi:hypothetical protein